MKEGAGCGIILCSLSLCKLSNVLGICRSNLNFENFENWHKLL